jgi:hypothetical protein
MDIIVRKVEGKIVVVSGEARLDAQLNVSAQAKVKLLASGKELLVTRNAAGELIEVNPELCVAQNSTATTSNDTHSSDSGDAVEKLLEKTANEFFKGKNKAHTTPISYGELVWVMRSLLTEAQTLPTPLEPFADHSQLVNQLWESDAACALTNQAARAIEKLSNHLQKAVNDRNAAWFQLEEAGIAINPAVTEEA